MGGSAPKPLPAFEKSGGKPAGKLLLFFGHMCWPAALWERRASFTKRVWNGRIAPSSKTRQKTAGAAGGAAGARSAHKGPREPKAPAARWFGRPEAGQTPPPPRRPRRLRGRTLSQLPVGKGHEQQQAKEEIGEQGYGDMVG